MGKLSSCLWCMYPSRTLENCFSNFKVQTNYLGVLWKFRLWLSRSRTLHFYQAPRGCWWSRDHSLSSKDWGDRVPQFTWGEVTPPPGGNYPRSKVSSTDIKGGRLNISISEEVRSSSNLPPIPKAWLPSTSTSLLKPTEKEKPSVPPLHLSNLQIFLILNWYIFSYFVCWKRSTSKQFNPHLLGTYCVCALCFGAGGAKINKTRAPLPQEPSLWCQWDEKTNALVRI